MFGKKVEYICKYCNHKNEKTIGGVTSYKINNNKYSYTPIRCSKCDNVNYVAYLLTSIDEDEKNDELVLKEEDVIKKDPHITIMY